MLTSSVLPFSLMAEHGADRRYSRRIAASVGVSVRSSQGQSTTGQTRDLSTNGIFLYVDSELAVGSDLEMVLMFPPELTNGEKRWVCCQASVVRVEPGGGKANFGLAANIRNITTLPEISG